MMWRRCGLLAMSLACILLVSCGSLLGGGKPAQLYRFGPASEPPTVETGSMASVPVTLMPIRFASEIESDRILTSDGARTAYIKGARWISPTPALFERELRDMFRARAPFVALGYQRDAIGTNQALQIDVNRFEASYTQSGVAPTIVVDATVTLIDTKSHTREGSLYVKESQQASANTIAAIVTAFDASTANSTAKIADWVSAASSGMKAPPPNI